MKVLDDQTIDLSMQRQQRAVTSLTDTITRNVPGVPADVALACARNIVCGLAVLGLSDDWETDASPDSFKPEWCEGCHLAGDFFFESETEAWVCRACGNAHFRPQNYEETHSYTRNAATCVGGESE